MLTDDDMRELRGQYKVWKENISPFFYGEKLDNTLADSAASWIINKVTPSLKSKLEKYKKFSQFYKDENGTIRDNLFQSWTMQMRLADSIYVLRNVKGLPSKIQELLDTQDDLKPILAEFKLPYFLTLHNYTVEFIKLLEKSNKVKKPQAPDCLCCTPNGKEFLLEIKSRYDGAKTLENKFDEYLQKSKEQFESYLTLINKHYPCVLFLDLPNASINYGKYSHENFEQSFIENKLKPYLVNGCFDVISGVIFQLQIWNEIRGIEVNPFVYVPNCSAKLPFDNKLITSLNKLNLSIDKLPYKFVQDIQKEI